MSQGRVVIVGAGLAGYRAAMALRRLEFAGEVTVIGDELHEPYDRPPLSKQLLAGGVNSDACLFDCNALDIGWKLGRTATALDVDRRVVMLDGDEPVAYDGLIVATGRRARTWRAVGTLRGVHTLRTLDDAVGLARDIDRSKPVVIIGAGFIGCEVAATLRGIGVADVTLVDIAPHPLPGLGPEVGQRAIALHSAHGVRLRLGTSVAALDGEDRVTGVRLESGEVLDAGTVLLSLGSAPSTSWLESSGLTLAGGSVVCDEHCFAVGRQDVVVAGDAAAYPYAGAPTPLTIEHWATARDLGDLSASNLIAEPADRRRFTGVPSVWSDQYDVKIKSAGLLTLADEFVVVDEDPERNALVVEGRHEGELVGAITFNRNRAMIDYQRRLMTAGVAA